MLKKKLIKENLELFQRLNVANETIKKQKNDIEVLNSEIETLKSMIEELKTKEANEPQEDITSIETENVEQTDIEIENDIEYGSSVIGKIVIAATEASNELSASGATVQNKELINLILGRTEVAKSEILSIVLSDKSLSDKKKEIDSIYEQSCEYFEGVKQQYK